MKPSRYNHFFEVDGRTILVYNSLTLALTELSADEFATLQALCTEPQDDLFETVVTGAAALLPDASSRYSGGGQAWLCPDQLFEALRCGAPTPDGVINIPASLYRCLP